MRLRYLTAGESHGPALVGILEGLPSGVPLTEEDLAVDLARRQRGYGRGGRMTIERDRAQILSGVRFGQTLGSPLALLIPNRDFASWTERMQVAPGGPDPRPMRVPRPGHTDLAGALKYGHVADLRGVLERASARETAMRVALGGAARVLLRELGVQVGSYVRSIGRAQAPSAEQAAPELFHKDAEALGRLADATETRALDEASSARLVVEIDAARARRDTVGGVLEVVVTGIPVGLGSHVQWDRKLDGRLTQALCSIPAIKAVELGDGWSGATQFGSQVHDPIHLQGGRLTRSSNHAGGVEGGISNGQPLVVRAAMKPIATLSDALPSVDLYSLEPTRAHVERSDTCAVPAAGVVAEAMVCLTLADAMLEALGGDTLGSLRTPFARWRLSSRSAVGHLFLVGPMGSGKSSVGRLVAKELGMPFVDLDEQVTRRTGKSVAELFSSEGEAAFRTHEAQELEALANSPHSVVALGGGAALSEPTWQRIRHMGASVRLTAMPEELLRRLGPTQLSTRPLLAGGEPLVRLRELLEQRERWYARADCALITDGLSAAQVAGAVIGLWRSLHGPLSGR